MRVLGAIDMAEGNSIRQRIKTVSQMTFTDEEGQPRQFTWRTIETWLGRYHKHGVTALENTARSDKGKTRKVSPEIVQEAIDAILPKVHGRNPQRATLYRLCIERGLLTRCQVAPNTFSRLVKRFEMLKPQADSANKHRLAFAKAHANEMWQADTLYGPFVQEEGSPVHTRLIAFLDDASRVCCHGQFFLAENVDTLIEAIRAAFYNPIGEKTVTIRYLNRTRWPRDQIRAARLAPLVPLLQKRGLQLIEREAGNFELPAFKGLIVKDSYWRWPERCLAGNAIDFFVHVLGLTFHDAMHEITGA